MGGEEGHCPQEGKSRGLGAHLFSHFWAGWASVPWGGGSESRWIEHCLSLPCLKWDFAGFHRLKMTWMNWFFFLIKKNVFGLVLENTKTNKRESKPLSQPWFFGEKLSQAVFMAQITPQWVFYKTEVKLLQSLVRKFRWFTWSIRRSGCLPSLPRGGPRERRFLSDQGWVRRRDTVCPGLALPVS